MLMLQFETPYERRGISVPGLPILPRGTERHPVPGGGSRTLQIMAGEEITVLDFAGLQRGELVFFTPDGVSDAAMLGASGTGFAQGLADVLSGSASGQRVSQALQHAGFDLAKSDAIIVFAAGSRPGDRVTFHAACDGLLVVAAPAQSLEPFEQHPATDLILYIRRAQIPDEAATRAPPDPLADPLIDINILPGHASAYEVMAGQYIQVLDVQGRECSDFQAFSQRALDRGLEREIDPTTTRSLTGSAYPAPGLFAKYYSSDQEPLLEIVQDTCGRHDAFNLACTARYYEDLGYPGHANCSDNINRKMQDFGVRERGGWPAINFFFNTLLDAQNAIGMDDPYSRPGDFVLLRALSDLVCVSTACPCDVDPANGWHPTDIQVRTYSAHENFQRSIAFRSSVESDMSQTKQTGFHDCFAQHTRDHVEYAGYWLPNTFTQHGAIAEYWAVRERCGVMDLSPLRKYEITGPDAENLLQLCLTRNVRKLSVGEITYSAMCYEHGGMIDDGTLYRLGPDNFRWVGGSDTSGLWLREQADKLNLHAWVRSATDSLCNIAIQGPLSREILAPLFYTPPQQSTVAELNWFRFTIARLGDFNGQACVISRTGYSGELGYELFCHPKDAETFFNAIMQRGADFGITPFGLEALDMLRIEAGLIFAGYEFCDQTDPYEAGIGFTVALKSTEENFIGREALVRRKASPQRKLVGLELLGAEVPVSGDSVRVGKAQVGQITSAMRSPYLNQVIALARIDVAHAQAGCELDVGQLDGLQKRLRAKVVPYPHFDPSKARVRGDYGTVKSG